MKPNTVVITEVIVFRRASRHEEETANEFDPSALRTANFKELDAEILQLFVANIGRHDVERK